MKYHNIRWVENREGDLVVAEPQRRGDRCIDEKGREKERYPVVPGAKIKFRDGARVPKGGVTIRGVGSVHDPDPDRGDGHHRRSGTSWTR